MYVCIYILCNVMYICTKIIIVDICCGTGSIGLTMAKVWYAHTYYTYTPGLKPDQDHWPGWPNDSDTTPGQTRFN